MSTKSRQVICGGQIMGADIRARLLSSGCAKVHSMHTCQCQRRLGRRLPQCRRAQATPESPWIPWLPRAVGEWATRRRRAEQVDAKNIQRLPSARIIARLMTTGRETLPKSETIMIAAIESGIPALTSARELIAAFHSMIRRKTVADLDLWLDRGRDSLVASFINGMVKDIAAVRAAITLPWSNGQTEG